LGDTMDLGSTTATLKHHRTRQKSSKPHTHQLFATHTGGGAIASVGRFPASTRPLPASRLMHLTVMSPSQAI